LIFDSIARLENRADGVAELLDASRIYSSVGQGGKVKSRRQAIAIGLSKARKKGKKVPRKKSGVSPSIRNFSQVLLIP